MNHSQSASALRAAALISAVILTALRVVILKTSFDEAGMLPPGSSALPVTVAVSACCFLALLLLALRLNPLPGREDCFSRKPLYLFLGLASTALLLTGSLLNLLDPAAVAETAPLAAALAGILSALCMGWIALTQSRSAGLFWLRLPLALSTGLLLILRFQDWSHDPMVIHIAPLLLAWTCCMVETMLLTGFPLKAGHRRSAALFGLAAGCFVCMALPDYFLGLRKALPDLFILLGVALWCVGSALELLRRPVQDEKAPEAPAAEASAAENDA